MAFTPVQTRRTFEEAVDQIAEKIRLGELKVGDRLPPERALAEQMQISRPTLREAIRALADAGLVEVRRGTAGGIVVAADYVPRELLAEQRDLRIDEVAAVLETRRLLEPRVAQLAAMRGSEDDFEAMEATIEGQRRLAERGEALKHEDQFLQLDVKFHLHLAQASGNPMLVRLVRSLYRELELARDMAMHVASVPEWAVEIHERTLAAVRSGELDRVETVMDEHLGTLERNWEEATGRRLVRPTPEFLVSAARRS